MITHLEDPTSTLETFFDISDCEDSEMASKLTVLGIIVKLKSELVVQNPALLNCLVVGAKSDDPCVIEGPV